MKRILWTIVGVVLLAGLVYYVMTHPNLDRADALRAELDKLADENRTLAEENERLEATILALRDDPRLAERRAREAGGLARPGEVIYQFAEPERPVQVEVRLVVRQEGAELAGKAVTVDTLPAALEELKRQIPGATLSVSFDDDVDAIRVQRVRDVIEASPLSQAKAP